MASRVSVRAVGRMDSPAPTLPLVLPQGERLWKTQGPSCIHCQMSWWTFLHSNLEFTREDPGVVGVQAVQKTVEPNEIVYGEGCDLEGERWGTSEGTSRGMARGEEENRRSPSALCSTILLGKPSRA